MAIHDLWSYDNAPVGTSLLNSSGTTDLTAVTNSTNPYTYYTNNPGCCYTYTGSTIAVDANGFLAMPNNSSGNSSMVWFKLAQVFNFTGVTKWGLGFRTKSTQAVTGSTAGRVFITTSGFATAILVNWILESDLVAAANTELYVELVVDSVALTYTVYVNGSPVRTASFSAANFPSTGYGCFGTGGTAGTANATRSYRDFYFLDFDSTDTTRLGPIRSSLATLSNIAGAGWTASGNTAPVLVGSAAISATQSKFGGSSLNIGQTSGAAASIPSNAQLQFPGDFTVEMWMYPTSSSVNGILAGKGAQALLWWANGGRLQLTLDGGSSAVINYTASLTLNAWHHVALTRQGTLWTIWLDGVSVGTYTGSNTWGNNANNLYIGNGLDQAGWGVANGAFPGYIDEVQVSNVARYTAGFTPSASPFTPDSNTLVLLHLDSNTGTALIDSSGSLANSITQALQNPPIALPNASAPANNQALTTNLGTAIATGTPIIALVPSLSLIGDSAGNIVDMTLSNGTQQTDLGTVLLPINANAFNTRWPITRRAPDGGVWTPAKVNQLSAIMTPSIANTTLLLHMETLSDVVGHTLTMNGNGALSTAQAKFGSSSLAPGSSGYISFAADARLVLGNACTIEGWMYRTSALGDTTVLSCKTANSSTTQTGITQQSGMALGIILTDGAGAHSLSGSTTLPLNQWVHWAVVYANGVYTGYLNGVAVGTFTSALTFGLSGGTYTVGGNQYNTASQFPGYLDEIRISLMARYTGNFTPPTSPFALD